MAVSSPSPSRPPAQPVLLAVIVKAHGLKGELVIRAFNEDSNLLVPGASLWMESPTVAGRRVEVIALEGTRLQLRGVAGRTEAELLRAAQLSVDRSELPAAGEGEAYLHDLIGFQVVDVAGRELGVFEGLQVSGSFEYFVVKGAREILLPAEVPLGPVDVVGRSLRLTIEVDPDEESPAHR